jgi:hypothetical protein
MFKPTCPICNDTLTEIECYDITFEIDEAIRFCVGECSSCNKEFQYRDIFRYHHCEVDDTPEN